MNHKRYLARGNRSYIVRLRRYVYAAVAGTLVTRGTGRLEVRVVFGERASERE